MYFLAFSSAPRPGPGDRATSRFPNSPRKFESTIAVEGVTFASPALPNLPMSRTTVGAISGRNRGTQDISNSAKGVKSKRNPRHRGAYVRTNDGDCDHEVQVDSWRMRPHLLRNKQLMSHSALARLPTFGCNPKGRRNYPPMERLVSRRIARDDTATAQIEEHWPILLVLWRGHWLCRRVGDCADGRRSPTGDRYVGDAQSICRCERVACIAVAHFATGRPRYLKVTKSNLPLLLGSPGRFRPLKFACADRV